MSFFDVPKSLAQFVGAEEVSTESRIYADSFLLWIYQAPKLDASPLGYLRAGQSVALRKIEGKALGQPVKKGCGKGWFAIEPEGYVCLNRQASLSPTFYSQNMLSLLPGDGPYLFQYALSMGSPSYRRIPKFKEWERKERIFGFEKRRPLPPHWRGHEELITTDELVLSSRPHFLDDSGSVARAPENRLVRRDVPFGSMLAINSAFEADGRKFLQSADGTLVPADRFVMFRRSTFEGVELGSDRSKAALKLPLAWSRKKTRYFSLKTSAECALDGTGSSQSALSDDKDGRLISHPPQLAQSCLSPLEKWEDARKVLQLTGRTVDIGGTRFAEASDQRWLPLRYLYLAEKRDNLAADPSEGKKWIHFRIAQGTLVSYEGDTPIFATLASPGIGGTPSLGADSLLTRTTPVGIYRIQFKHLSDDMSPEQAEDREFWIADVPYAMYFKQPFAIHVAYWHESFGEPMSGGCINVSPKDGQRLFNFADPQLPKNWYGVSASVAFGLGTTVVIDR